MQARSLAVITSLGVLGLLGSALGASAHAQDAAPARHRIAESCGQRFVELVPQHEPQSIVWGRFGDPIDSYYGVVARSNGQADDPQENAAAGPECAAAAQSGTRFRGGVSYRWG